MPMVQSSAVTSESSSPALLGPGLRLTVTVNRLPGADYNRGPRVRPVISYESDSIPGLELRIGPRGHIARDAGSGGVPRRGCRLFQCEPEDGSRGLVSLIYFYHSMRTGVIRLSDREARPDASLARAGLCPAGTPGRRTLVAGFNAGEPGTRESARERRRGWDARGRDGRGPDG
eukprot:747466-Hanusia_phi.AAC.2